MSTRRGIAFVLCALCFVAVGWLGGRHNSGSLTSSVHHALMTGGEEEHPKRRLRVDDDNVDHGAERNTEEHHEADQNSHSTSRIAGRNPQASSSPTEGSGASAAKQHPTPSQQPPQEQQTSAAVVEPAEATPSTCPPWNRTVEAVTPGFNAEAFCRAFNESARRHPIRVWYGMMFSFELDMLEVILHETSMVVDKYVIVESQSSHSKKQKPLFLSQVWEQERFRPFLPQLINGTFVARRSFRSGWDYEKRQRKRVLQVVQASGIRDGDLFIANLDLDEVFSRKTVMRYKFCSTANPGFHSFGFRYYLNCLQDESVAFFQRSIIYWLNRDVPFYDLYRARTARIQININISDVRQEIQRFDSQLVWHMSTFGSFKEIRFKQSHSPHRFVDGNDDAVALHEINHCIYNNRTRYLIDLYPDMLPNFIARNLCRFKELGWVRSIHAS